MSNLWLLLIVLQMSDGRSLPYAVGYENREKCLAGIELIWEKKDELYIKSAVCAEYDGHHSVMNERDLLGKAVK